MTIKNLLQGAVFASLLGALATFASAQSIHQWTTEQADQQQRELSYNFV